MRFVPLLCGDDSRTSLLVLGVNLAHLGDYDKTDVKERKVIAHKVG